MKSIQPPLSSGISGGPGLPTLCLLPQSRHKWPCKFDGDISPSLTLNGFHILGSCQTLILKPKVQRPSHLPILSGVTLACLPALPSKHLSCQEPQTAWRSLDVEALTLCLYLKLSSAWSICGIVSSRKPSLKGARSFLLFSFCSTCFVVPYYSPCVSLLFWRLRCSVAVIVYYTSQS